MLHGRRPRVEPLEERRLLSVSTGSVNSFYDGTAVAELAPADYRVGHFELTSGDWTGKATGRGLKHDGDGLGVDSGTVGGDPAKFDPGESWSFQFDHAGLFMGIQFADFSVGDADRAMLVIGDHEPIEISAKELIRGFWRPDKLLRFDAGETLEIIALAPTAKDLADAEADRIAQHRAALAPLGPPATPLSTWKITGIQVLGRNEETHGGYLGFAKPVADTAVDAQQMGPVLPAGFKRFTGPDLPPTLSSPQSAPGDTTFTGLDIQMTSFTVVTNGNNMLRANYSMVQGSAAQLGNFELEVYRSYNGTTPVGPALMTKPVSLTANSGHVDINVNFSDVEEDYYLLAKFDVVDDVDDNDDALFAGGLFWDQNHGVLHYHGQAGSPNENIHAYSTGGEGYGYIDKNDQNLFFSDSPFDVHIRTHTGDDTIRVDDDDELGIKLWAFGGAGNDLIIADQEDDLLHGGAGMDSIYGGQGDDDIWADDSAFGYGAGDYLFGQDGDDTINGGGLADWIDGGAGVDTLFGGHEEAQTPTADWEYSQGYGYAYGGGGYFDGGGGDFLFGGSGDDAAYGGFGHDFISGDADHDLANGEADNDYLFGGDGNDALNGGDGNDRIEGGAANDTLYGNAGHDVVYGNDGNDTLNGGGGIDHAFGGAGDDTYQIGNQSQSTVVIHETTGVDTVDLSSWTGSGGATIDLANTSPNGQWLNNAQTVLLLLGQLAIENVVGTGFTDIINGNSLPNMLDGRAGSDYIHGKAGDDELRGGANSDSIYGGDGIDELFGGGGGDGDQIFGEAGDDIYHAVAGDTVNVFYDGADDDRYVFGPGNLGMVLITNGAGTGGSDTLDFSAMSAGVEVSLTSTEMQDMPNGLLDLLVSAGVAIEDILGTEFADTIIGNSLYNLLAGGEGADEIHGEGGDDVIYGGDGDDSELSGGDGDDLVFGEEGNDDLFGNDGDDALYGGDDDDLLNGGDETDNLDGGAGDDEYQVDPGDEYVDDLIFDEDGPPAIGGPAGPVNHRPQLNPMPSRQTIYVSKPFSLQFTATDSDQPAQVLTYSVSGTLPPTASFSNGSLTWEPTQQEVGEYTFTVTVTDNGSVPLSDNVTITISVVSPTLDSPRELFMQDAGIIFHLYWKPVSGATHYIVQRRLVGNEEWSSETVNAAHVSGRLGFMETGSVFEFRVAAINQGDGTTSEFSLPIRSVPPFFSGQTNLQATSNGLGGVNLAWTYNAFVTVEPVNPPRFSIYREDLTGDSWVAIGDVSGEERSFVDPGPIAPNHKYRYSVIPYGEVESLYWAKQVVYGSGSTVEYTSTRFQFHFSNYDDYLYMGRSKWPSRLGDEAFVEWPTAGYIGVNRDYDEQNHDDQGNLVPDNMPDISSGDRIIPLGDPNVIDGVILESGTITFPNRIMMYDVNGPIQSGTNYTSPLVNVAIEGISPSATKNDVLISLAAAGGTRTYSFTVVDVDIEFDGLTEAQEDEFGAMIRRNNDFSKGNIDAPEGLPVPDYEKDGTYDEYKFDFENHEVDLTSATVTWNADAHTDLDVVLTFAENILVWDVTDWDGSVGDLDDIKLLTSGEAFTSALDHVDLMIEGLDRSSLFGDDSINVAMVPRNYPWVQIAEDTARYTVVEVNALVDGDRNGEMEDADPDDRSLVFWYNSDREGLYGADGPTKDRNPFVQTDLVTPPPGAPEFDTVRDSRNSTIDRTRDLEDFASLSLYLDPLLMNNPNVTFDAYVTLEGNPSEVGVDPVQIRLFETAIGIEADARQHVINAGIGSEQVTTNRYEVVTAFDEFNFSFFQKFLQGELSGGLNSFIFEAVPPSTVGQMTFDDFEAIFPNREVELIFNVDVNFGGGISQTFKSSVKLDLHDITEFYDTFVVDHTNGMGVDQRKNPDFGSYSGYDQTTTAAVNDLEGSGFNNDNYILFVHGWNMSPADKKSFAETTFKHLYWQGYSGRFGTFDWPTFFDAQGPHGPDFPLAGEGANLTYFASELQAWRSGQALKNVVSSLRQPDPMGKVHVSMMAHSMGNYVTAEAMRLWRLQSTAPLVDTYAAMEGAISAGAFGSNDNDATTNIITFDLYRYWSLGTNTVATGGRPYMSDELNPSATWSQPAATNRVNFYNPDDYALTNFKAWPAANANKPFGASAAPVETWQYNYSTFPFSQPQPVLRVDSITHQDIDISGGVFDGSGRPGTRAYEIMAFVSGAKSLPIGAKAVDWFGGANKNINIQSLGLDPAKRGLEPDSRANHSFQFNHDATITWNFWEKLKDEIGFASTYDMTGNGSIALFVDSFVETTTPVTNSLIERADDSSQGPSNGGTAAIDLPTMSHMRNTLSSVWFENITMGGHDHRLRVRGYAANVGHSPYQKNGLLGLAETNDKLSSKVTKRINAVDAVFDSLAGNDDEGSYFRWLDFDELHSLDQKLAGFNQIV